jgi:hypothetical protein
MMIALVLAPLLTLAQAPRLAVAGRQTNGWLYVQGSAETNHVYTLSGSPDLIDWQPAAVLLHVPFEFADAAAAQLPVRFYRMTTSPRSPNNDWENQTRLSGDPFFSASDSSVRWIKFAILVDEPHRVYFQDSGKYLFHYDFATARLAPFRGMTPEEFAQVSVHPANQQVILGAVLCPNAEFVPEYGIQFVGHEPYPPETIVKLFELVKSTVNAGSAVRTYYMPTYDQARSAEANKAYFEQRGILLDSVERWLKGANAQCYAFGWALGPLQFVPAAEITAAYADGRLRHDDILLTDAVPAEVPFVSGIITLTPATPNSHVAILARSYEVPFVYFTDPTGRERIRQMVGREIILRSTQRDNRAEAKVLDVEGLLEPAFRSEILALKGPKQLSITPKARYGASSAPAESLMPGDIQYFGGKAANFGLLRRAIPTNSPEAIAFSFDLWDDFLDQRLATGQTLRQEIAARLAGYRYPPNVLALRASLAEVRTLITKTARFTPQQQQAIIAGLVDFNRQRKIRFRSSTNVEDAEQFTGAGMYDSFSGCPADDLDDDTHGPSGCDPTEPEERGVFRAIQKVYASFYNENAFLERLRFGLDEAQLGMGLLVHYSFPDEIEMANGVATLRAGRFTSDFAYSADLVTQVGAVSVTNPDGTTQPETVHADQTRAFAPFVFTVEQRSSLVPLGETVLSWHTDYRNLMNLLTSVSAAYGQINSNKSSFLLDFEYKKVQPGQLIVKQVREVPGPPNNNSFTPILITEPIRFEVAQEQTALEPSGASGIFAIHRLKSKWQLQTRNILMTASNLTASFYTSAEMEFLDAGEVRQLTGRPEQWPNAWHSGVSDGWSVGSGTNRRDFTLDIWIEPFDLPTGNLPVSLSDFQVRLTAIYATPQDGVQTESVFLVPTPTLTVEYPIESVSISTNGVSIVATVYRQKGKPGLCAPTFAAFKETQIAGLTSQPIVLRDYYAQTRMFRWGAHNGWDDFLFEPHLDRRLSPALLEELRTANIRFIRFYVPQEVFAGGDCRAGSPTKIRLIGWDGALRDVN